MSKGLGSISWLGNTQEQLGKLTDSGSTSQRVGMRLTQAHLSNSCVAWSSVGSLPVGQTPVLEPGADSLDPIYMVGCFDQS